MRVTQLASQLEELILLFIFEMVIAESGELLSQ